MAPILEAVRSSAAMKRCSNMRASSTASEGGLTVSTVESPGFRLEFQSALETAAKNMREYAELQLPRDAWTEFPDGRRLGSVVRPLESMGAYIPAGRYPLPSTLLMTVIPAQVAGVRTICVTSPHPSMEILAAAKFLEVENIFRIGGAQAIAALAFGTATVPKVDRIVGPGNIYVAAAKKLLAGEVGIDFVAGPTEIVIIAEDADPRYIAADMLAQAEHDVEASSILLTTSRSLAEQVVAEVARQLESLATAPVACEAIRNNSAVILCPSMDAAVEASNQLAPEHLAIYDASLLPEDSARGQRVHWTEQSRGRGRLCDRSKSRAAHFGGGANSRRTIIGRFREGDLGSRTDASVVCGILRPPSLRWRARKGLEAHARSIEVRLNNEVRHWPVNESICRLVFCSRAKRC